MRILYSVAVATVVLTGCARRAEPVAVAPPPPPIAAAPAARPAPPSGASANVVLPRTLDDGSFDTPNRALTPAATAWHLRAALNVAALRCNDPATLTNYNTLVKAHAAALKAAHTASTKEAGGVEAFDGAMTRLYNYFALPPVQTAFCAAAATVAEEGARTPASEFARFVGLGLPVLDAPFTNFFTEYAAYRTDLAKWEAGQLPRLTYDMAVMTLDTAPRLPGSASRIAVAAR